MTLANGSAGALDRMLADRRQVTTNSSCGLCGRLTIESLHAETARIYGDTGFLPREVLAGDARAAARGAGRVRRNGRAARGRPVLARRARSNSSPRTSAATTRSTKSIGRMLMREALPLDDRTRCSSAAARRSRSCRRRLWPAFRSSRRSPRRRRSRSSSRPKPASRSSDSSADTASTSTAMRGASNYENASESS